jgi:hypothetical protein
MKLVDLGATTVAAVQRCARPISDSSGGSEMQRNSMKPLLGAIAVAAGAMAIAAPQASAQAEYGRVCRPGPNGNVCTAVGVSGDEVRGRVGIDAKGTGATICTEVVHVWQRFSPTGPVHPYGSDTDSHCSTIGHVTVATAYQRLPCDRAATYEVRVAYSVTLPNGSVTHYGYPEFPSVPVRLGPVPPFCA